jgi:hypothetical protein
MEEIPKTGPRAGTSLLAVEMRSWFDSGWTSNKQSEMIEAGSIHRIMILLRR